MQRHDIILNNFLLHVPIDLHMLNHRNICNTNNFYYSSIWVLIDFINSAIAILL